MKKDLALLKCRVIANFLYLYLRLCIKLKLFFVCSSMHLTIWVIHKPVVLTWSSYIVACCCISPGLRFSNPILSFLSAMVISNFQSLWWLLCHLGLIWCNLYAAMALQSAVLNPLYVNLSHYTHPRSSLFSLPYNLHRKTTRIYLPFTSRQQQTQ